MGNKISMRRTYIPLKELSPPPPLEPSAAAIHIQRVWRGFYNRQWYSPLWDLLRAPSTFKWPEYIIEGAAVQIQRKFRQQAAAERMLCVHGALCDDCAYKMSLL